MAELAFEVPNAALPVAPVFSNDMLYFADARSGDIFRADVEGKSEPEPKRVANTGGQPAGLCPDEENEGVFYVADVAHSGILTVNTEGGGGERTQVVMEYEKKKLRVRSAHPPYAPGTHTHAAHAVRTVRAHTTR